MLQDTLEIDPNELPFIDKEMTNENFIKWFKTTKEYGLLRLLLTEAQIFEKKGESYYVMCVSTAQQAFEYLNK